MVDVGLYVVVGVVVVSVVWLFAGNLFNKNPVERRSPYVRGRWVLQDFRFGQSEVVAIHDLSDGGIKVELSNGGSQCYQLNELKIMDWKQALSSHNAIIVYAPSSVQLNTESLHNTDVQASKNVFAQTASNQLRSLVSKDLEDVNRRIEQAERIGSIARPVRTPYTRTE